jgi:hypothetical protein
MKNSSSFFSYFVAVAFGLNLSSCSEATKGCLNPRATNFDVTVDEACDDCCTFPTLQLVTTSSWDTLAFSTNAKYRLANGDSCQILSWRLMLSNFELLSEDNKIFRVKDSIILYRPTETLKALNDIAISTLGQTEVLTFGTLEAAGKFRKVSFDVGLSATANGVTASKMTAVPPLSSSSAMYLDSVRGFSFQRLQVRRVTVGDTLTLNLQNVVRVHLDKNFTLKEGFAAAIPLKINVARLMQNVNLNNTQTVILQKIAENTPFAFEIP